MNNKGVSLVEIIFAIALTSIVLMFLYNLLAGLNEELTNPTFSYNNQLNRLEIIDAVQKEFLEHNLTDIEITKKGTSDYEILFSFQNSQNSNLRLKRIGERLDLKYEVVYTDIDNVKNVWDLEMAEIDLNNILLCKTKLSTHFDGIKLQIPVYTTNEKNSNTSNNYLDDLVFVHVNDIFDLNNKINKSCGD